MNQKELQMRINEAMRHVRFSNKSGSHENCIRLNPQSKGPHNDKIVELCKEFLEMQIPFFTEAIFMDNRGNTIGRGDILLPATHEVLEIMHTETDERFEQKKYPDIFKIKKIRA